MKGKIEKKIKREILKENIKIVIMNMRKDLLRSEGGGAWDITRRDSKLCME